MKKSLVAVLAIAMTAPAFADNLRPGPVDRSNVRMLSPSQLHAEEARGTFPNVYNSNVTGAAGNFAAPAAAGPVGADDYVSTVGGPTFQLADFGFTGGVTAAGQVAFFTWFTVNTAGTVFTPVASFGAAFPSGGNYIWTITFAPSTALTVPSAGVIQMYVDPGFYVPSTGRWFLTSPDAVTEGSNNPAVLGGSTASGNPLVHRFRMAVPDPATISLLGLGSLFLARRRK